MTARQRVAGRWLLPPISLGHLVRNEAHIPIRPASNWANRANGPWEWRGTTVNEEVSVQLALPWHDMVLAEYEDPTGRAVFCHHSDRADCVVRFSSPRRPDRTLRSLGMAHVEVASRTADPRVLRRVMQV